MTMSPYDRLEALGLVLPPLRKSAGAYVPARFAGNFLYLSGRGGAEIDGSVATGVVGADFSTEQAYLHAQSACLQLLAAAHDALGDLGRIEAVVKVFGLVNALPGYGDHPKVIDGCSDLLQNVLGDKGRHARSAVGVSSLPQNMSVEVEAILLISARTE